MKKIFAISGLASSLGIFLGLVIWTLAARVSYLVGGGSTSVEPLLNDFVDFYTRSKKGRKGLIYNAIGSSATLAGLHNRAYQFGFLSKTVSDDDACNLAKQNIMRFVVARDPIMIIYSLGHNNLNQKITGDSWVLEKNEKHIVWGSYTEKQSDVPSAQGIMQQIYGQKGVPKSFNQVFSNKINFHTNKTLQPLLFTREEGSGTREFFEETFFEKKDVQYPQGTTYVNSNALMLKSIAESSGPAIGYLSFSYLKFIMQEREKYQHVHVAACFNSKDIPELPWTPNSKNMTNPKFNVNYKIYRPFTGLFSTKDRLHEETMRFIAWMINPYPGYDYDQKKYLNQNNAVGNNAIDFILKQGLSPVLPGQPDHFWEHYNDNIFIGNTWSLVKKYCLQHEIPGSYQVTTG